MAMGIAVVGVGLALCLTGAGLTVWLGRRVWKMGRAARLAVKVLTGLVLASAMYGAFGVGIGLMMGMSAVGGESIDPSQKARMLAEGIAEAMNCAAVAWLIWIPSFVAAFILVRRNKGNPVAG